MPFGPLGHSPKVLGLKRNVGWVVFGARFAFGFGMGFIGKFWRGELGFVWTVLLLIGVTAGLNYGAGWGGAVLLPVLVVVSVWQCVGAVRFGERVLRDGALTRVYGVYAAMGVALVSNLLIAVGVLLPAPPVDLSVTGYAPKVAVVGGVATVTGAIDYQVLTELKAAEGVRVVLLDSEGGNVQAGRAIGLFLAARGLNTRVDGRCYSACTLVFAGGVSRELGAQGRLGFHGYRFDGAMQVQTVDKDAIEDKDRDYFSVQGFDGAFVERIFATAPDDLWVPSRDELIAAGVLR